MTVANLSDVKNNFSQYARRVRRGERVRVMVRGVAVLDLVPVDSLSDDETLAGLEARGVLERGTGGLDKELLKPGPRVRGGAAVRAILDERDER